MESQFIYHVVMVLLSYLGLWYPGFYAVHLLDFVFRDRILQGVIASITLNGSSISHTVWPMHRKKEKKYSQLFSSCRQCWQ